MKSTITEEKVARYVNEEILQESALEKGLRAETMRLSNSRMISSADVGTFLYQLALLNKAKRIVEVGTFTGYTALKMAQALPEDGRIICCDISEEWTSMGKPYWSKAGLSDRIDLRLAPAGDTLGELLKTDAGTYDMAFIDADKTGYDMYYEQCLQLLRPGGVIVLDNMLWNGAVADPNINDESTLALKKLNSKISQDRRVIYNLLTVGDGLMLVIKK